MGLLMALAVGREADAAPTIDPLDIQGLELADGQMMPRPPVVAWGRAKVAPNAGIDRMQQEQGRIWASWDPARQHPGGIMTTGIPAPGTIASPTRAADFTREFLARYIDLLAPGSSIDDFVVVSNDLSLGDPHRGPGAAPGRRPGAGRPDERADQGRSPGLRGLAGPAQRRHFAAHRLAAPAGAGPGERAGLHRRRLPRGQALGVRRGGPVHPADLERHGLELPRGRPGDGGFHRAAGSLGGLPRREHRGPGGA